MKYTYFVAPFKGSISSGQRAEDVAKQLQDLINHYESHGWEFVETASVDIEVKPGCLGALLGAKVQYVRHDQVIFRKAAP